MNQKNLNKAELEAMANTFSAMKKHKPYLEDLNQFDNDFNDDLPDEKDEWWKK